MAQRYCTNCGAELPEGARFCGSCGKPAHETAAVATPEADVDVTPPRQGFQNEEAPLSQDSPRKSRSPIRVDRLDKIVGLVIGAALLLAVLWFLVQFFVGFLSGFFGAL